MTDIK